MIPEETSLLDAVPLDVDPTTGELLTPAGDAELDGSESHDPAVLRRRIIALEEAVRQRGNDVQYAERELRAHRRKIKALEDELTQQRNEVPEAQTAKAIYQRWLRVTGRNAKRAKFGAARQKAVLARIREGHNEDRLIRAVDGAPGATTSSQETQRLALLAVMKRAVGMVSDEQASELRGLYAEQLKSVVIYDDLELIFRNEVNVERFAAMADRIDPLPAAAEAV